MHSVSCLRPFVLYNVRGIPLVPIRFDGGSQADILTMQDVQADALTKGIRRATSFRDGKMAGVYFNNHKTSLSKKKIKLIVYLRCRPGFLIGILMVIWCFVLGSNQIIFFVTF